MHEDLIQLIDRSKVAFPGFGEGVSANYVSQAEASLGIPFPESYKWWLLNYGIGQIKGDIVYGLDEKALGAADIVALAKTNEQDGLYDIGRLVFCMGNAENFFFDTTKLQSGEYPVILHDISQDDLIPYAVNFAEFLRKRIGELYGLN